MPSCAMRYCTNYTRKMNKSQGITYHSFPSNELRRIQWMDIVRQQRSEVYWQPNKSSKICSIHFKDVDKYISTKGLTLLKKAAVPALGDANIGQLMCDHSDEGDSLHVDENMHVTHERDAEYSSGCVADALSDIPEHELDAASSSGCVAEPLSDIPEGREVIVRVYRYLQNEYRQLKEFTGNCCDLSVLENILKRTADATGVSERTVTHILEQDDHLPDHGPKPKRHKMMITTEEDNNELYSDDIALAELSNVTIDQEDNIGEEEDTSQEPQVNTTQEEPPEQENFMLETIKIEYVENETSTAIHSIMCVTEETPVKMEPDSLDSSLSRPHHESPDATLATIKTEPEHMDSDGPFGPLFAPSDGTRDSTDTQDRRLN